VPEPALAILASAFTPLSPIQPTPFY